MGAKGPDTVSYDKKYKNTKLYKYISHAPFQPNNIRKYPQNLITKTHRSVNKRPPRPGRTVAKIMGNNSLHSRSPNPGQCAVSMCKLSSKCLCPL